MARKQEQQDLIDVQPENAEQIAEAARQYQRADEARKAAKEVCDEERARLLELIHEADLQPLEDGTIMLTVGGLKITVKPREDAVQVKGTADEAP